MFNSDIKKEKISLVIFMVLLIYLFYQLMQPFLMTLFLASIFVVLFHPLYEKLKNKLGNKPRLSSFLVTVCIFFIILLPATFIVTMVVDQSFALFKNLDFKEFIQDVVHSDIYQDQLLPAFDYLKDRFGMDTDIIGGMAQFGKTVAATVSKFSPKVVVGTAGFFFDFFLMIVGIYFLFLEGPKLLKMFYDISPMRDTHERRLLREFSNTIHASVNGYLLTSLVQALLATIAFWATGLKGSVVLGTLVFFMSMVPVIGAAGVWVPVCIWLFIKGEMGWGIFNAVWGFVLISGIDNVLKPIIIQGRTKIHPLMVFFSLFGGIALFGPLGILFGPVITAMLIATIRIYRDEFV